MRTTLPLAVGLSLACGAALAGKRAPPAKGAPEPATPSRSAPAVSITSVTEAMARLEALYTSLEYDQVIPLADALLARDDLSAQQRLDAYRLQGSARAIVEDPVDAERPFRLLLRARPDYELPPETPPKILAVFRKVQSEEQALASQLRVVERGRLIANLTLTAGPLQDLKGGRPIPFAFRLRDTAGVVASVRVEYRRAGQPAFASLPLERADSGEWRGSVPGELTASEAPYTLEYLVETADAAGPLLVLGSRAAPLTLPVAAGQVPRAVFKPVPRAVFWPTIGVTAALGVATGVTGFLFNREQASYAQATRSMMLVQAAALAEQARRGESLASTTNALLVATAVSLVAVLVLLPLTRFVDE
jgi:hypothetical protein